MNLPQNNTVIVFTTVPLSSTASIDTNYKVEKDRQQINLSDTKTGNCNTFDEHWKYQHATWRYADTNGRVSL